MTPPPEGRGVVLVTGAASGIRSAVATTGHRRYPCVQRRYAQNVPLGRIGQPEEIAAAVAFLADPRVGAMTGQILQLNGGEVRCRA
ncbi:MAG TPA: SDR family oxidoreductase [Streptosporangiaceae bacterium]|nr:SDR family oxidoreductase [Streptosporangiaceae bacterium]